MASESISILVVEDEPAIAELVAFSVKSAGWTPVTVYSGTEAWTALQRFRPDVVLLDWMLPDLSGMHLLNRIREHREMKTLPVIMLTAKTLEEDKVAGLDQGADDYITKPFDSKEMAARVKAVLRRTMGQTEEEEETADDTLSFPGLTVSLSRYEVFYEGKKLEMPPKELEVLYFLASHVNQLFTRGQLLDQVWGFQVEVESRTVDVHVKRLRDKLVGCEKYGWRIQTIWGRGYKFEVIK